MGVRRSTEDKSEQTKKFGLAEQVMQLVRKSLDVNES